MKSHIPSFKLLLVFTFFSTFSLIAQGVGIGTTSPRTTLEVAGDAEITGTMSIGNFNGLTDGESSAFLIQDVDDSIKSLDVSNPTGAALAYIQEYIITNADEDWVRDFDTGIDATDFVVVAISAHYDLELNVSTSANAIDNASLPYTATFIKAGTWHIIADYPMAANLDPNEVGTWIIKTLIFSKDLSKQFGSISIPMSDTTTGSASSPLID